MATLQQQVMSQTNLQPVVERVFPGKNSQQVGEIIDNIRLNMTVQQVPTDLSATGREKEAGRTGQLRRVLCELHRVQPAGGAADLHRS